MHILVYIKVYKSYLNIYKFICTKPIKRENLFNKLPQEVPEIK